MLGLFRLCLESLFSVIVLTPAKRCQVASVEAVDFAFAYGLWLPR